jgi:hypothetical protein
VSYQRLINSNSGNNIIIKHTNNYKTLLHYYIYIITIELSCCCLDLFFIMLIVCMCCRGIITVFLMSSSLLYQNNNCPVESYYARYYDVIISSKHDLFVFARVKIDPHNSLKKRTHIHKLGLMILISPLPWGTAKSLEICIHFLPAGYSKQSVAVLGGTRVGDLCSRPNFTIVFIHTNASRLKRMSA